MPKRDPIFVVLGRSVRRQDVKELTELPQEKLAALPRQRGRRFTLSWGSVKGFQSRKKLPTDLALFQGGAIEPVSLESIRG
jgi:hypothetical protein